MNDCYKKHAYLFLVCRNTYVFEKTLQLIDDERNDIYIHVDLKCRDWNYKKYESLVKKSRLIYVERINCNWAAYSQLKAEIILLKAAATENYSYYHLMSESCMPIKTQDEIHDFFEDNSFDYLEMMGISDEYWSHDDFTTNHWTQYYYFLTENRYYRKSKIVKGISRILLIQIQKLLGVNRWKAEKNIYGDDIVSLWGWNWFSFSHNTVKFLISKEEFIDKHFKMTHAPDEVCFPTLLYNYTDMKNVRPSKRNIVFDGKPSVITMSDYGRLMDSDDFFARKFDENIDRKVIDKIFNKIISEVNDG
ncbi:MAG: beta-1,6-N-acetylglucosaminyltransferase [Eubacterium sp.]